MATVPLSGTDVRLLKGIPFNSDYKHSRWFASKSQQTSWFTSRKVVHRESRMNFQRIEGYHFVAVNKSIDELWGTNYLMFKNSDYSNKWFYAFVTKLEYKQRNNTHVHFKIDVLQTWGFDMNFKPSFVVREHQKLWESNGDPVINNIDEGLDYGYEYETMGSLPVRPDGYKWLVIVAKQPIAKDDDGIKSSVVGTPQPLRYYIVPYDDDDNVPNAYFEDSELGFKLAKPSTVLEQVYKAESTVNNIVSIYVTDYIGVKYSIDRQSGTDVITFPKGKNKFAQLKVGTSTESLIEVQHISHFTPKKVNVSNNKYSLPNMRSIKSKESKLMMYPYTVLVVDDFKGNRQEYKLEYINKRSLELVWKGSIGTSNFNSVSVDKYNRGYEKDSFTNQTSNEDALISNSPNDIPVLNDMLSAFLQGNRNSIQNRQSQISFNALMDSIGHGVAGAAAGRSGNPFGVASSVTNVAQGLGNSVYEMQAIQAKQQDINNVPPELQKMGSNTAYNYGNDYNGVYVMIKQIKPEYKRVLEDFFNMFGYKSNRVKVPNFRTRKNWNYIETKSCVITGDFNNDDLEELKSIFDNGICLWHTDDVGNYNLDNGVR